MKKKGFTLIELLVVIAIIAMLLAILMPALNKVKKIAQRVVCGTNLKGLGTAQRVYANDYEDAFAVQNAKLWTMTTGGFKIAGKPWPANCTVGASLYLLVREADVSPKSFICGAGGQNAYEGENDVGADITEMWDFGIYDPSIDPTPTPDTGRSIDHGPKNHVSYSYHMPYGNPTGVGRHAADGTRSASFAIMADKNPWYDPKLEPTAGITPQNYMDHVRHLGPYWSDTTVQRWQIDSANAYPHSREGQNVSFGDGHSSYEKTADIGVKHDNIYTTRSAGTEPGIRQGNFSGGYGISNAHQPVGSQDSFLVNDDIQVP